MDLLLGGCHQAHMWDLHNHQTVQTFIQIDTYKQDASNARVFSVVITTGLPPVLGSANAL